MLKSTGVWMLSVFDFCHTYHKTKQIVEDIHMYLFPDLPEKPALGKWVLIRGFVFHIADNNQIKI